MQKKLKSEKQSFEELKNEINKTKLEDLEKYIKEKKKEIETIKNGTLSLTDYYKEYNKLNNKLNIFKDLNKIYKKENLLNILNEYEKLNKTNEEDFKQEKDYELYKIIILGVIIVLSLFLIILYIFLVNKIINKKLDKNSISNTSIIFPNE